MSPHRSAPQRARPVRATRAGFTLVELMVVIIIIGLIGGIAVASWASMLPNQQFNSALRDLSEVVYGTRSDAISRNREFRIVYDLDKDTYRVRTPFKLGGGLATSEDDDERLWIHETNLKKYGVDIAQVTVDDVKFVDGKVEVVFSPLGTSSYHTVQLVQTLFGREVTLEVLPLTGEIRMHDGAYARAPVSDGDFR